jgi:predicted phosphodiesterase
MRPICVALLSDLHLDLRPRYLQRQGADEATCAAAMARLAATARETAAADLVVLAGDIAAGTQGLEWAAATFAPLPVVYVAGNHEFYRYEHRQLVGQLRQAAKRAGHVHFLEQDEVRLEIAGRPLRVLGCTAWTDYGIYDHVPAAEAMHRAETLMYDHRRISFGERVFMANDALELHLDARRWLAERLAERDGATTLVVTHHAPTAQSVEPRFRGDSLSPAFASELTPLIEAHAPELWIHGHTHWNVDYRVGATRIVTHQWGYPIENVAEGCKVVEV